MGTPAGGNELILLMDRFSEESRKLYTSFRLSHIDCRAVVIEDDGFLPEDVISVYGFFLGNSENAPDALGQPRYFNQIRVPDYWEISGNNNRGFVHDLGRERGRIFYSAPAHKRLVKTVDWLDERGVVRTSEHYDRCGVCYARTIFNARGQKVTKSYFDAGKRECIVENYVTGDIILNDGEQVRIFARREDFVLFFLEKAGLKSCRIFYNTLSTSFFISERLAGRRKRDILFWQESKRPDIPGNMQVILSGRSAGTQAIYVQNREAYDGLLALGADASIVHRLGYVYPFVRAHGGGTDVLICTNSDRIAHCRKIVEAFDGLHFHIAAITEMSQKLMDVGEYANVTLYPNVKTSALDRLFARCDWYLDINYENEIVSAVRRAFLNNQLIFAFGETLHSRDYVAPEHVFSAEKPDALIAALKELLPDQDGQRAALARQREHALAESAQTYQRFVI